MNLHMHHARQPSLGLDGFSDIKCFNMVGYCYKRVFVEMLAETKSQSTLEVL